jgi:hypothetical protein
MKLVDANGEEVGTVRDLWLDVPEMVFRYVEVELADGSRRALVPMTFCRVTKSAVKVHALLASQYTDVPATRAADRITLLEEERICAYFGAGLLYAEPSRLEPLGMKAARPRTGARTEHELEAQRGLPEPPARGRAHPVAGSARCRPRGASRLPPAGAGAVFRRAAGLAPGGARRQRRQRAAGGPQALPRADPAVGHRACRSWRCWRG